MPMRLPGVIIWVALLVGILSCSVERDELVGRYEAILPFATVELELRDDGLYEERVMVRSTSRVLTHTGRWEYRNSQIALKDPLIVDDNFGRLNPELSIPQEGLWLLSVSKRWKNIRLTWAPDFDYRFTKTERP